MDLCLSVSMQDPNSIVLTLDMHMAIPPGFVNYARKVIDIYSYLQCNSTVYVLYMYCICTVYVLYMNCIARVFMHAYVCTVAV